jgi:hypothetical protein
MEIPIALTVVYEIILIPHCMAVKSQSTRTTSSCAACHSSESETSIGFDHLRKRGARGVMMSEVTHTASNPPPAASREFWLKVVIGFGVFATAAWTGLLGYGFLKLLGLP